jgi:hypothetical protein
VVLHDLITKACYVDYSVSLVTDGFLRCLEKCIATRGNIKMIYSDCGTNFVSLENIFRKSWSEVLKDVESELATNYQITMKRSPVYSANFNGGAEHLIKTIKTFIKKIKFFLNSLT